MVLIAIELLAQSPGLAHLFGKNSKMDPVTQPEKSLLPCFVIGIIGFMLDRIMMIFQKLLTFTD
jgi:nitrate/nitrite transport system permease protein